MQFMKQVFPRFVKPRNPKQEEEEEEKKKTEKMTMVSKYRMHWNNHLCFVPIRCAGTPYRFEFRKQSASACVGSQSVKSFRFRLGSEQGRTNLQKS
jgi:hypothetical protein